MQFVEDGTAAEIEGLLVIDPIGEIRLQIGLADLVLQLVTIDGIEVAADVILVIVNAGRQDAEKLIVENMFPFYDRIFVAIFISSVPVEPEIIIAYISGQINIVFSIDGVADVQVGIVKRSQAVAVG